MDVLSYKTLGSRSMTNLSVWSRISTRVSGSRSELVEPPTLSRVNGCSRPLHGFQLLAWTSYGFLAIVGLGIFVPLLPSPWSSAVYGLMGGLFIVHLLSHVSAMLMDPADLNVRSKKDYSSTVPVFNSSKHTHVIQNLHCTLCEVDVGPRSKHCSACNKCIADFDHHCKWLNNCVGGRNYWLFFSTISSAVCGVTLHLLVVLFVLVEQHVNPTVLRSAPQFQMTDNTTWLLFLPVAAVESSSISLLVLGLICVLLGLVALVLLGHLLGFHLFLLSQGISTYDYIMKMRHSSSCKDKDQSVPSQTTTAKAAVRGTCFFKLDNRVARSSESPETFCAEMESVTVEIRPDFHSQVPAQTTHVSNSVTSLPDDWTLGEQKTVVQNHLVIDVAVVHQQLKLDTDGLHSSLGESGS